MSDKKNIRVTLAYDGTDFFGWQIQRKGRTIQGEIEKALSKMHKTPVAITGAGRTDSGVHARGQVFNFYTHLDIPLDKWKTAMNSVFPKDLRVLKVEEVDSEFHSRYNALSRMYKYYILPNGQVELPFDRSYRWRIFRHLDISRLNEYAERIVGVHDFTSFSNPRDENESKIRYVFQAVFFQEGPYVVFKIEGNAFLWKMVRTIIGTIFMLYENGDHPDKITEILDAKDRSLAGNTAPPTGLFLEQVRYGR